MKLINESPLKVRNKNDLYDAIIRAVRKFLDTNPSNNKLAKILTITGKKMTTDGKRTTISEVLNFQQRMKRRQIMRRLKSRIKMGRKRAKYKLAKKEKLVKRSNKAARQLLRKRMAGKMGERYKELSLSTRAQIDKKLENRGTLINRISKRLLPKVRKKEFERLRSVRAARTKKESILFKVNDENIYLNESEFIDMIDDLMNRDIKESIQRNLEKKAEKYDIDYEILEDTFVNLKDCMSESEAFDRLNIWLVKQAISEEMDNVDRVKANIKKEKKLDKRKHDSKMDRARLVDTLNKNRETKRT